MGKEYKWSLPVGDTEKEISCEVDGNKYHLYIGDAFVNTFYKATTGETDEELELCGVPCRFVAFNEKPDLVVNGVLLGSGKTYEEAKAKSGKFNKGFALAELSVGVFTLAAFIIWTIVKGTIATHYFIFIFPALFIAFGVYELLQLSKAEKSSAKAKEGEKPDAPSDNTPE